MNLEHPSQRVLLHLCALAHRPGHLRFHLSGILREIPEDSALPAIIATAIWFTVISLLLIP